MGVSWEPNEDVPWESRGDPVEAPWVMKSHKTSWDHPSESHGSPMGLHCKSMGVPWEPMEAPMGFP